MNDTATQQKIDYELIDIIDNIKDNDNPFNDTFKVDPENIFIEDDLFDHFNRNNKKDIKMVSDNILQDQHFDQNDILFEELRTYPVKQEIIKTETTLELAATKIKKTTTDKE